MAPDADVIADEAELEAFQQLPAAERKVTGRLRGVIAEIAVTGVIRYDWQLLRPLLLYLLQNQLQEYESVEKVDVGPARPLESSSGDVDVSALIERFSGLLWGFQSAPWTLQRLCEVLLEPRKQYNKLHKLVLALEKLLLVTGEVEVTPLLPPPPRLQDLARVNEAPMSAVGSNGGAANADGTLAGHKRPRPDEADGAGLVAAALDIKQAPPQPSPAARRESQPAAAAAASDTVGNAVKAAEAKPANTASAEDDATATAVQAAGAKQTAGTAANGLDEATGDKQQGNTSGDAVHASAQQSQTAAAATEQASLQSEQGLQQASAPDNTSSAAADNSKTAQALGATTAGSEN